jgi:hypothetical protein
MQNTMMYCQLFIVQAVRRVTMVNPFLGAGCTLGKIAAYKSGKIVPDYEKHMRRVSDLTERMFLLTVAYRDYEMKPDFELHIRPLIDASAPLMGTDLEYDEAVGCSSHEFCFTSYDTPNVLAAAYMYGDMTPEPHHFEKLPPSQFKAWALAAAFLKGLPPTDEHLHEFAHYENSSGCEYQQTGGSGHGAADWYDPEVRKPHTRCYILG